MVLLWLCWQGIVDTITTLYDEHFRDPTNDATVLPYMEGDYWIGAFRAMGVSGGREREHHWECRLVGWAGEAENLIKEIEDEEKDDPQDPSGGSKKRKAQKKKVRGAHMQLIASNMYDLLAGFVRGTWCGRRTSARCGACRTARRPPATATR